MICLEHELTTNIMNNTVQYSFFRKKSFLLSNTHAHEKLCTIRAFLLGRKITFVYFQSYLGPFHLFLTRLNLDCRTTHLKVDTKYNVFFYSTFSSCSGTANRQSVLLVHNRLGHTVEHDENECTYYRELFCIYTSAILKGQVQCHKNENKINMQFTMKINIFIFSPLIIMTILLPSFVQS